MIKVIVNSNSIAELPAALFEIPTLQWLKITRLPITTLPIDVAPSSVAFQNSNVTVLRRWMLADDYAERVEVHESVSPYCTSLPAKPNPSGASVKRI
ncbi:hypothetical protein PybrP1_009459 [[Pythium] brassicae (nom. inval.)]|nr:hypothetical protein PybrP1_009459 [[Pythium] brassicae (nom. inval.)]